MFGIVVSSLLFVFLKYSIPVVIELVDAKPWQVHWNAEYIPSAGGAQGGKRPGSVSQMENSRLGERK